MENTIYDLIIIGSGASGPKRRHLCAESLFKLQLSLKKPVSAADRSSPHPEVDNYPGLPRHWRF